MNHNNFFFFFRWHEMTIFIPYVGRFEFDKFFFFFSFLGKIFFLMVNIYLNLLFIITVIWQALLLMIKVALSYA